MTDNTIHPWERAGLGKAPFRFIGMEEKLYKSGDHVQPGGCCAYCSQGIRYVFNCRSADGKVFGVGCDCIARVHAKGVKVLTDAERALRNFKKAQAATKLAQFKLEAKAVLAANPALLTDKPHPSFAGKTLRDYVEWMFAHAGATGNRHACNIVKHNMPRAK